MKPSLTDMSTWAYTQDIWLFLFALVGIIVGVALLHIDD